MNKTTITLLSVAIILLFLKLYITYVPHNDLSKLKPGTIIITNGYDKNGSRAKILAITMVKDTKVYGLQIKPLGQPKYTTDKQGKKIDISTMGHLPISEETLITWGFKIIGFEEVKDSELDGYKMWLEAKGGFF